MLFRSTRRFLMSSQAYIYMILPVEYSSGTCDQRRCATRPLHIPRGISLDNLALVLQQACQGGRHVHTYCIVCTSLYRSVPLIGYLEDQLRLPSASKTLLVTNGGSHCDLELSLPNSSGFGGAAVSGGFIARYRIFPANLKGCGDL